MRTPILQDFSKPAVSYASLKYYVKLTSRFDIKEALETTGLSKMTLIRYLEGGWSSGKLIKKEKNGWRVSYRKLNDSPDPREIAKELLAKGGVSLVGYDSEYVLEG